MDQQERTLIEDLFGKLRQAEGQSGPRDPEAEGLIRTLVNRQPAAPYLMAQAIVVQEHALGAANARIQELEAELAQRPASGGGGIFGGGKPAQPVPQRSLSPRPQAGGGTSLWGRSGGAAGPVGAGTAGMPYGSPAHPQQGGGFLAGAMQTAVGVAGGVLLGNAISGLFAGDATAAEAPIEPDATDAAFEDTGVDAGFDAGGFDGGGFE